MRTLSYLYNRPTYILHHRVKKNLFGRGREISKDNIIISYLHLSVFLIILIHHGIHNNYYYVNLVKSHEWVYFPYTIPVNKSHYFEVDLDYSRPLELKAFRGVK